MSQKIELPVSSSASLESWESFLACPHDKTKLSRESSESQYQCNICSFQSRETQEERGEGFVFDFRDTGHSGEKEIQFKIPAKPLKATLAADKFFFALKQEFPHIPREEIRQRFGTKIDKSIQFYCQKALETFGEEARILDLGCGNGGNREYLKSLGFKNILSVDYRPQGAQLLVDAHRLPFLDSSFDLVLSTAVLEHLYNPFIAIEEMSRVLQDKGFLIAGASFLEIWHDSSYFHFTPDGWNALCNHAGLEIEDMWPGWGVIPPLFSMIFTPGKNKLLGYEIQAAFEKNYREENGEQALRLFQLQASGSLGIFARKTHE